MSNRLPPNPYKPVLIGMGLVLVIAGFVVAIIIWRMRLPW